MKYCIGLEKDECDFILKALQYLQNEKLKESLEALKNMKYQNVKGFFVSEEFFNKYKENQINMVKEQIEAIDSVYNKITNEMEGVQNNEN